MCSLNQIVAEARQLMTRLHDREKLADEAVARGQSLQEKISSMKEYEEEVAELNAVWSCAPRAALVAGLQAENRQIRGLQAENRELKCALDEHAKVLELLMQRHRQLMMRLPRLASLSALVEQLAFSLPMAQRIPEETKILQLSRTMNQCLLKGEEASHRDEQELSRLNVENFTLRELLNIASCNDSRAIAAFHTMRGANAQSTATVNASAPNRDRDSLSSDETPTGSPQHQSSPATIPASKLNGHTIRSSVTKNKKLPAFFPATDT